jgi:uncharacterized membrane protein YhaH (DUF805 family)
MSYFIKVIKNYAVFTGRARRMEYWYFQLFSVLFGIVFTVVDVILSTPFFGPEEWGIQLLASIYWLALLIPCISVGARRLHDIGCTGWWQLLMFIPLVGSLILIFAFLIRPSEPGENQYGSNPIDG